MSGGSVSLTIAVLAVVMLAVAGSMALAIISGFVAIVCLWSWLPMRYFARILARQRLFVAALHRGEFEQGSPEAERYWREMKIQVDPRDAAEVPNWITMVNLLAAVVSLLLLIWGVIGYWVS